MRMRELQGFASPVWKKNLHPTGSIFFPQPLHQSHRPVLTGHYV